MSLRSFLQTNPTPALPLGSVQNLHHGKGVVDKSVQGESRGSCELLGSGSRAEGSCCLLGRSSERATASSAPQGSSASRSPAQSQFAAMAETGKKCRSFAKIFAFLWLKSRAYSIFFFPFFTLFIQTTKWERKSLQQSEVLQRNEQFVFIASKRKEPEQVVFHFVSRGEKKVNVCGLWCFKVGSGQRTGSECLPQLPAKGGRWIRS